jgi:hypothetical protein
LGSRLSSGRQQKRKTRKRPEACKKTIHIVDSCILTLLHSLTTSGLPVCFPPRGAAVLLAAWPGYNINIKYKKLPDSIFIYKKLVIVFQFFIFRILHIALGDPGSISRSI